MEKKNEPFMVEGSEYLAPELLELGTAEELILGGAPSGCVDVDAGYSSTTCA